MNDLINWMINLISNFGTVLMEVLPRSPFADWIESFEVEQFAGILNWFVPVGQMASVFALWLVAVGLFYMYSILMRWIKMIGD